MAINLKEILISDDNNIKLDKVNYNFDQLVANGGGPQGVQGPVGVTGYQGITGYQGFKGDQGVQGPEGSQGSNGQGIWKINTGTFNGGTADTILPIQPNGYPNATSVIIGYKTSDPEYDDTYVEQDSQVVIHRHDTGFSKNLQLRTEGVDAYFNFVLENNTTGIVGSGGNIIALDMSFENTAPGDNISINQYANTFTWNDDALNLIKLNSTELEVEVDAKFKDVIIEETLKIKPQNSVVDATDYIAVSSDSDGTVVFKSIADIGGVVPIGTMVSMIPSQFSDNTKFINQQLGLISSANNPLEIRVGAGINEHAGWYICNGKTWTNGTDSFITPDLNSFSYTIDNDPNISTPSSQGQAALTNNISSIIGGADTSMSAVYNGTSFDINGTVDTSTISFNTGTSGTGYTVKRLPQIIFLGLDNLYWSDAGDNATDTVVAYAFSDWQANGGGAGVSANGVPSINQGNDETIYYSNSVQSSHTPSGPNNTGAPRSVDITLSIVVPSGVGFSNENQTVTGVIAVTQDAAVTQPTTQTYRILANKTGTTVANDSYKIVDGNGNEISGTTSLQPTYSTQSSTSSDITNTVYLEQNEGYLFLSTPAPTVQFSSATSSTITTTFDSTNNRWKLEMLTTGISDDDTRTETIEINTRAKIKNQYFLEDNSTNPSSLAQAERNVNDTFAIGDNVKISGSGNVNICYEIIDIGYVSTPSLNQVIDPCATGTPSQNQPAIGFFEDKNTDEPFTNNQHTMLLGNDFEVYVVSNKEFVITIDQGAIIQLDSTDSSSGNAATDSDNEVRKFNVTGTSTGNVVISLRDNENNGAVMATLTVTVMEPPTSHIATPASFNLEFNGLDSVTTTHTLNNEAVIGTLVNQYPITYSFVDPNEAWVNSTINYDNDSTATITWQADTGNSSPDDRTTTITVSIAGLTQNLAVTQYGEVIPGNSD